ncbi:MAG: glycosyltransferase WbuB [Acidobacteria bacterium]|nr:glycosyltransferase WbuB [Acidobacteriota bacterium]
MKILLLVDCYFPKISAGAKLIHDLAAEFVQQGHEVTILTPLETISVSFEIEIKDRVRVARVRTGKIKGARRLFRAFQEFRLSWNIWRRAGPFLRANPADLIVFYSPSIFWGPLVKRLKSMWKCSAYLILRDIFPQWAVDAGLLHKGLAWRFLRAKELEQYRAADIIGVQSPANLDYFAAAFPHIQLRTELLYNWTALQETDLPATSYRKQWGLENKIVFLYGGNIGVAQDMDNIIRLAENLSAEKHIHFLLIGSGSEEERVQQLIGTRRLQNVQILPAFEPREYLATLSEFDVGLISLDRRLTTHNVPGKLLGYLYCGLPVLASLNPGNDLFAMLENNQAGICLLNGDDVGLTAATLRLSGDPQLRASMGRNGRRLLECSFSAVAAARQILGHFVPVLEVPRD